ncbi:UNVERIFIED_CONTAM: hypothetical protein Sradi_5697800 [Sesamum radiatum]|uniref:Uncharacterized protein n=1 Tax=Sesamum radiatum TaxID=300843 RepID=A0AAW2L3Z3_SESRA
MKYGTIPKSFGNLKQLGSLDLSVNRLRGEIPEELTSLTFLSFLNISYNKLVGRIPVGPQFLTFSASSYTGNTGLCGFPLETSCNPNGYGPAADSEPDLEETEFDWQYVFIGLGYGFGAALAFASLNSAGLNSSFTHRINT